MAFDAFDAPREVLWSASSTMKFLHLLFLFSVEESEHEEGAWWLIYSF